MLHCAHVTTGHPYWKIHQKKKQNQKNMDCVEIKGNRLNLLPGLRHAHKQERYHTKKYLWSKVHKTIHFTESGIYSKVPC